jgi:hypothetical protein
MRIIIYSGIDTLNSEYIDWQRYQFCSYSIIFQEENLSQIVINILENFHPKLADHYGIDYIFLGYSMLNIEGEYLSEITPPMSGSEIDKFNNPYFIKIFDNNFNYIYVSNLNKG